MSNGDVAPELKQILGGMIFGAKRPLTVKDMRRCLAEVAEVEGGETAVFGEAREKDIRAALSELEADIKRMKVGLFLQEMAGGYRLLSDSACGKWVRHLLDVGKPNRLSQPGLETLAIIAYRQPVSRAEIEGVRGVNVDHIVKTLMEMQLVRIVGRSELPGRPLLYGTTQTFLEHFGLKDLSQLSEMEPMLAGVGRSAPRRPATPAGSLIEVAGAAESASKDDGTGAGVPEQAEPPVDDGGGGAEGGVEAGDRINETGDDGREAMDRPGQDETVETVETDEADETDETDQSDESVDESDEEDEEAFEDDDGGDDEDGEDDEALDDEEDDGDGDEDDDEEEADEERDADK